MPFEHRTAANIYIRTNLLGNNGEITHTQFVFGMAACKADPP